MVDAYLRPTTTRSGSSPQKGAFRDKLWSPSSALLFAQLPPLDFILWPDFQPCYKECRAALRKQQLLVQDVYQELVLEVVEDVLKSRMEAALTKLERLETWSSAPLSILLCVFTLWLCLHGHFPSPRDLHAYRQLSVEDLKQGLQNAISADKSEDSEEVRWSEATHFDLSSLR